MQLHNPSNTVVDTIIFVRAFGMYDSSDFKTLPVSNLNKDNILSSIVIDARSKNLSLFDGYTFFKKNEPNRNYAVIYPKNLAEDFFASVDSLGQNQFIYPLSDSSYYFCKYLEGRWRIRRRSLIPPGLFIPKYYTDTMRYIVLSTRNAYNEKQEIINTVHFMGKVVLELNTHEEIVIPLGLREYMTMYDVLPVEQQWIWNEKLQIIETLAPDVVHKQNKK